MENEVDPNKSYLRKNKGGNEIASDLLSLAIETNEIQIVKNLVKFGALVDEEHLEIVKDDNMDLYHYIYSQLKIDKRKINTLKLKYFKNIKEMRLDFNYLNYLTGTNSAGKSTILQSILMISQSIRARGTNMCLNG